MNEIKITVPDGHKAVINGQTITFEPVSTKPILADPKEGEFWYVKRSDAFGIFQKRDDGNHKTSHHYDLVCDARNPGLYKGTMFCENSDILELRPATPEEKQRLIDAVKEQFGKDWNGTEWVDILKVGELAIFWDYKKTCSHLGPSTINGLYKSSAGASYRNAIKCNSIEQYTAFRNS